MWLRGDRAPGHHLLIDLSILFKLMLDTLQVKVLLTTSLYLITTGTVAQTLPPELIGTWGPPRSEWGRGDDGKNTRCEANPNLGNNTSIFYGFFPDGDFASGNLMGYQCRIRKIDRTSSGYAGIMSCRVEGSIKETHAFQYIRYDPPRLTFRDETLYKCKSTP